MYSSTYFLFQLPINVFRNLKNGLMNKKGMDFTIIFLATDTDSTLWQMLATLFSSTSSAVQSLIGAFIVGMIGSGAYYSALKLGFINSEWIEGKFNRWWKLVGFVFLGGAVATVFQLPQADTFTAIQSFVLGITWPFIVSQYVSRAQEDSGVLSEIEKRGGI